MAPRRRWPPPPPTASAASDPGPTCRRPPSRSARIVQEIDIATGRVVFEWHSYPSVPEKDSVISPPTTPDTSYDYFHLNAIDVDTDGNLLVSARNTSTVYKLDRRTVARHRSRARRRKALGLAEAGLPGARS
jgi:hypothetical protein